MYKLCKLNQACSAHAVKAPTLPSHQEGGGWSALSDGARGPVTEQSLASRREAGEREIEWVHVCAWVTTAPAVQQNGQSLAEVSDGLPSTCLLP